MLNPHQFGEHLRRIEEETGIGYGPGRITLPGGQNLPALHFNADSSHGFSSVSSYIPSELGSLHKIEVRRFDEDTGRNPDFMLEHYSVPSVFRADHHNYDKNIFRSSGPTDHLLPEHWAEGVARSVESAEPLADDLGYGTQQLHRESAATLGGRVLPVYNFRPGSNQSKSKEPDFLYDLKDR